MAGQLATIEDLYAFQGKVAPTITTEATNELNAALARASTRIKRAMRTAQYVRAADGLPASDAQRTAITEAVCAEYLAILAAGGDLTGAEPLYDAVAALGVSFSRRTAGTAARQTWTPADGTSPEAAEILIEAGFFTTAVRH